MPAGLPQYNYISSATTTAVSATGAVLNRIVIGDDQAGDITVYNNTSAAAPIVALLKSEIGEGVYEFDITCTTGITVKTADATLCTVVYTPIA